MTSIAKAAGVRLAIVAPWFGASLRGGAEQQAWQLAHHLATRGYEVEVLTTCSASFDDDWSRNRLRAGVEHDGSITVRRFKVGHRDRRAFSRVNAILTSIPHAELKRSVSPVGDEDAAVFAKDNINSPDLVGFLSSHAERYRAVIFIPYLYGTTLAGVPAIADRAYLQPCLHDEPYAYLPAVGTAVHAARGLLFNSEGELEVAVRIFGPGIIKKSTVVGQGVDDAPAAAAEHVAGFVPKHEHYVLYLGRQDPAKNIGLLVHAFGEFKRRHPMSRLKLVLAGERPSSYGDISRGIIDVGPVEEPEKLALLANARALVQPSVMESYSRVMIEAWLNGRPVIVHEDCLATATVVRQVGGGLLAGTTSSWEGALYQVDIAESEALAAMGALGRDYAEKSASWERVIDAYEDVLGLRDEPPAARSPLLQLYPEGADDVRRYADALAEALSHVAVDATSATKLPPEWNGAPVVVHEVAGRKTAEPASVSALVYHASRNGAARNGSLAHDAGHVRFAFGSSPGPVRELDAAGFRDPQLLPVCVDPRQWDCEDDRPLAKALQDGCTNLVYAGPFTALEHLNQLLTSFLHYLTLDRESRLVLVRQGAVDESVYARLYAEVRSLDLVDHVLVARDVTVPQLQSVYRTAHLFWSLDESESFGENFLQAMWFDVPILAYKSPIASRFVAGSGVLLTSKDDLLAVAAAAQLIVGDRALRRSIVAAQRRARAAFDCDVIAGSVAALVSAPAARVTARSASYG